VKITKENVSRKLDSLGRISIPKGIRDRMRLEVNEEMEFFSLIDDAGEEYVCFTNHKRGAQERYNIAIEVLKELKLEVPEELREKVNS